MGTLKSFVQDYLNYFKEKEKDELRLCDGIVCLTQAAEKLQEHCPSLINKYRLK